MYFEDCRALFVTGNSALAKTVRSFFGSELNHRNVPPCITDHSLTYLLWLKSPQLAPDLPKKRLIADCYAATQPTEHLWRTYLSEIDKLEKSGHVSENDYFLLRYSMEAKRMLMEITQGETEAVTEGTVAEVLKRIHEQIERELTEKVATETDARRKAEEETEKVRQAWQVETEANRVRIENWSFWFARCCRKVLTFAVLLLLAAGVISTFPWKLPTLHVAWYRYVVSIVQFIVLVLTIASLYSGTHVKNILSKLEKCVFFAVHRYLTRAFAQKQ